MALEALRNKFELREMCQFEADVYSFAMICSKILSKKDPFYDVHEVKGILDRIEKGERPNLPSNCEDLIELIQECWRLNPLHQPKFANVCERLESLKKKYLIGIGVANAPKFGASKNNYHQNIEFQQIHNRLPLVDVFEEEIFGLIQCLLRIRQHHANKVKALHLI
uniref:Protein kinase domain-containing protein n=1 Tax=Physcomitrium patens TaxID=3218 RepID=A0A7I4BEF4_PHYPA